MKRREFLQFLSLSAMPALLCDIGRLAEKAIIPQEVEIEISLDEDKLQEAIQLKGIRRKDETTACVDFEFDRIKFLNAVVLESPEYDRRWTIEEFEKEFDIELVEFRDAFR